MWDVGEEGTGERRGKWGLVTASVRGEKRTGTRTRRGEGRVRGGKERARRGKER